MTVDWNLIEKTIRDIVEESDKVIDTEYIERSGEIKVILTTGEKIYISVSGFENKEGFKV